MKKLVIALAILVLISGCAKDLMEETPQPAVEQPVVEAPIVQEPVVEEPVVTEPVVQEPVVETPTVMPEGIYTLKFDEPFTFDNVDLKLTDIDTSAAQFRIEVNGKQIIFHNTREPEIASGLMMEVATFKNYGLSDPRTYLNLSIKRFELGDNEYLVEKSSPVELPDGSMLSVSTRISDTNVRTASVSITGDNTQDVLEGKSVNFNNYTVTNLRTFGKSKEYAWLRVEPL